MKNTQDKILMAKKENEDQNEVNMALENIKTGFVDYRTTYNPDYQLRKTVSDILIKSGFFGTSCYFLMIEIILEYLDYPLANLKDIYKIIAEKKNNARPLNNPLTIQNIDRSIRTGIDKAWNKYAENNIFYLNRLFGVEFFNEKERPTSKGVITAIVSQLILQNTYL